MKILLIIAMLIISYVTSINNLNAQEINWRESSNWNDIKSEAKVKDKFIFIDCYATWCGPCKKMDKEVYINDSVANFINEHFISVRLQMDSTTKDSEEVKKMYGLVKQISAEYKISGFPTLLFFSPNGILINRELGFTNSAALIGIAKDAINPTKTDYYSHLELYKGGKKDYTKMKDLSLFAANVLGDKVLSKQIANDFIANVDHKELLDIPSIYFVRNVARNPELAGSLAKEYLTAMPLDSVFTKSGFKLIADYSYVLTSSDRLFQLLKNNISKMDSVTHSKGRAKDVLEQIIMKEELYDRLIQDGKPILDSDPEWSKLKSNIESKYSFINADKLLVDFKIDYYRSFKLDWKKWAEYKQQRITKYPPNPHDGLAKTIELNDGGAWDAFLHCNDKDVLQKTLPWIDMAIKLSTVSVPQEYPFAYMDTKANVLYKIGRASEAIKLETQVIKQLKHLNKKSESSTNDAAIKEFSNVLKNMKDGKPTYLEQGAKWNNYTLPKKQEAQMSSSKN